MMFDGRGDSASLSLSLYLSLSLPLSYCLTGCMMFDGRGDSASSASSGERMFAIFVFAFVFWVIVLPAV